MMGFVGRDVIPPNQGHAGCHPAPHHLLEYHYRFFFMVLSIRSESNINVIALSGGVWQNRLLLARILARLHGEGFQMYFHRQAPTNDGGLALGQAAVAIARSKVGRS